MTEENNIIPDPVAAAELEAIVVNDEPAVAVEETPQPEPTPAPVVEVPEPTPAPVVEEVKVAPTPVSKKQENIASGNNADNVYLANCIYKNKFARKSLTVHHLQRRLNELGYKDAYTDKDGWLGDLTRLAIENFQKDRGLAVTGNVDADTFTKIFEGDPHVVINL